VETSRPVVIVGQGALGTLLGAVFAERGGNVHVVSRRADEPEPVDLEVRGRVRASGEVTLRPDPPEREAWLAIVCTRTGRALDAARATRGYLAADGLLATVQNGLVPLEVADELGPEVAAPLVVGFNAALRGPRTARVTSNPRATTGPLHADAAPKVDAMRDGLTDHLRVRRTDDARGAVWSKLCVSCALSGLAVLAGDGLAAITDTRDGRASVVGVVTETARVAEAAGVDLERVAGPVSPDALAGPGRSGLGGAFRRGVVWLIGRGYAGVVPSALSAVREGRDPELDHLNGRAVEEGEAHGVSTPWNEAVLELADEVVAGDREPGLDQLGALLDRVPADA
jgi:2-dehydropantoate 2-reductase